MGNPKRIFTESQTRVLDRMAQMAEAYFARASHDLSINPRFGALLIAPTGSGKTSLCQELADRVNATLFVISASEWIPRGVKEASTIDRIVEALDTHERVVLLIDELDKFTSTTDSIWSRSLAGELWGVCDRRMDVYPHVFRRKVNGHTAIELKRRVSDNLYLVGAGTFQDVYARHSRPSLGFSNAGANDETDHSIHRKILGQGSVSPELLSRFSPRPLFLKYPDLRETADLLQRLGLSALAAEVGQEVRPEDVCWEGAGMRALENLAADLVLARIRKVKLSQLAPAREGCAE